MIGTTQRRRRGFQPSVESLSSRIAPTIFIPPPLPPPVPPPFPCGSDTPPTIPPGPTIPLSGDSEKLTLECVETPNGGTKEVA